MNKNWICQYKAEASHPVLEFLNQKHFIYCKPVRSCVSYRPSDEDTNTGETAIKSQQIEFKFTPRKIASEERIVVDKKEIVKGVAAKTIFKKVVFWNKLAMEGIILGKIDVLDMTVEETKIKENNETYDPVKDNLTPMRLEEKKPAYPSGVRGPQLRQVNDA